MSAVQDIQQQQQQRMLVPFRLLLFFVESAICFSLKNLWYKDALTIKTWQSPVYGILSTTNMVAGFKYCIRSYLSSQP